MKKLLMALVAGLVLISPVQAATYSVDITADPYRVPGAPGLQTRAVVLAPSGSQNFNGSTISFDLTNPGDSFSADIYGLVTFETAVDPDDFIASPSTATFDFGFAVQTILGTTGAVQVGQSISALAQFIDGFVDIGGGQRILISLTNTVFGAGTGLFTNGRPGVGFVNATFTLAAVPLPASLPLGVSALALLGLLARRRKPAA